MARYAMAFDPMRQAALHTFSALGGALEADGEIPTRSLPSEVIGAAEDSQEEARKLERINPPEPLTGVQALASSLAAAKDAVGVVDAIVGWHQRHRAAWIARDGAKFVLGRRANFDFPIGFHGYTVPSYFSLLADLERAKSGGAQL